MEHDLPSKRLALTSGVVMALGAGLITAGVIVGSTDGSERRPGSHSGGISLVAYDSCDAALSEMKNRILPYVGPYGLDFGGSGFPPGEDMAVPGEGSSEDSGRGGMAAPEAAPMEAPAQEKDHSNTNVHEAGVDEPDLVKTDGERVVSITDGVLRVVDVASRTQTATVPMEGGGYATQLLLAGDRALVMSSTAMAHDTPGIAPGEPAPRPAPTDTVPYGSQLVLVDLTGAGRILGSLAVDGSYLDARQIGDVARVVVRSMPRLEFRYPRGDGESVSSMIENHDIVENSRIQDWLPRYELKAGGATSSGQLPSCADVSHPEEYTAGAMLTVLTFDLKQELGTGDPVTIVADGDTVYGTDKNLYVADDHAMDGGPSGERTELYQFDISAPGKPVHVASGGVDGTLLNQYSLSEHKGHLRVATTGAAQGTSQSMITVLERRGNELAQVGQVSGLGAGERIYAVRYIDDVAYVVTFRQTDPLYTVDLKDPKAPKLTGELKIPGYSAYLHPAGEGRLIGVGQEADQNGSVQGAQVSLFDTSDPAGAERIAQYHLPYAWTEVESDPHAFLYWPDKGLVVLPMSDITIEENGASTEAGGALVLKLKDNTFAQVGMLNHMSTRYGDNMPTVPRRAIVIGNELWTVSEVGVMVSDLDSLSQLAWLPFS